jgi:uncharacterized LabA/DUF88 family protein
MPKGNDAPMTEFGRFAIFIDGSNFYHTIRDLGLHVDYRRLLEHFCSRGKLVRAHYYTALLEGGQSPDWLVRLTDWLAYNGYQVVIKRAKSFRRPTTDEQGNVQWINETKGDIDIEITVDMIELAPHCDTILLCSGDGDFLSLIRGVQRMGCRVVVLSSERTGESTVADELRRQADLFIDITSIADQIRMRSPTE